MRSGGEAQNCNTSFSRITLLRSGCAIHLTHRLVWERIYLMTSLPEFSSAICSSFVKRKLIDVWLYKVEIFHVKMLKRLKSNPSYFIVWCDGFSGVVVSKLASGIQVRGFKPDRSRWIFTGVKSLSMPSSGGEVKESVPCHSFAACKRTW